MGVNVCEPAAHGEESKGSRSPRWAWLAGFAVAAIALFLCYLRFAGTYPTDTDGSDQALQAWDMLHGNLLLHGWTIADVTYYTTEIPQYMLIELVRGLGPEVGHIAGASTYTLLVLAAGLLARGRATGRDGLIRLLVAAGIMLAPQFGNATHLLLSQPDHLGTQLPLLLVFLLLDRGAAALVHPGRGRRGARLGHHRRPGGAAGRGRAARPGLRRPRPAGRPAPP